MIVLLPALLQDLHAGTEIVLLWPGRDIDRMRWVYWGWVWVSCEQMSEEVGVGSSLFLLSHIMQFTALSHRRHIHTSDYIVYSLMTSTCLLCCEQSEHWVLPPCNHREICWKCCLKLVDGSIFSCPFCKDRPEVKSQLLFVTTEEMESGDYAAIMRNNPFKSSKNTFYYYSCASVAEYIEAETSFHCTRCGQVHESLNLLRRHLNLAHRLQFCEVCLDNRRCITGEQRLFTDGQLQVHLKQGDLSESGEVLLYHPLCQFCARRFYDLQAFRLHLRMSSHLKCEVCDLNAPRLKFVYYKGYDQLEKHHRKTHHVCQVGDCLGKKLENVFASQGLLEEHKRRCHRKHRNDKPQQKVENILLGFNQTNEQDAIEFDGIGRNLQKEFAVFDRQQRVDKQQHNDELIDIREFYPEVVRNSGQGRPEDIVDKLEHLHQRFGAHPKEIRFNDVPLYKPLQMPPLSRTDCERLLKRCFGRQGDTIIEIFFTKRHEYGSVGDYLMAIERKMKSVSTFGFFLVFPQLVRFMKDENKNKQPMDTHYALRLRTLAVGKELLCHAFDRYSQMLEFLRGEVRQEIGRRCEAGEIEIDKYCKYLREMSSNYYVENQDQLYLVPREKATNLYHMIERCRTRDFLKLNWLLKVGLPQAQYQLLVRSVQYKTKQQCQGLFRTFRTKELALLNLYFSICLQALLDNALFEHNKRNPRPHYLSDFLVTAKPKNISHKLLDEIRGLEGHSSAIQRKTRERVGRPIVVDEGDCPSLLQGEVDPAPRRKPPEEVQLGIGKARLPIWNEDESVRRKKGTAKPQEPTHDEEFPVLLVQQTKKNGKNGKTAKEEPPEEDFPVFNFQEKYVQPKKQQVNSPPEVKIQSFLGFNNKTITSKWDESRTRERLDQMNREREQLERAQRAQRAERERLKKQSKKQTPAPKQTPKGKPKQTRVQSDDEDEYLKMAIQESLLSAQQEERERNNRPKQESKEVIIISKKNKKDEEDESPKKGKKKQRQEQKPQEKKQPPKQEEFLFEAIERQAQMKPKKEKPMKMRIDYSDSDEEPTPKPLARPQPKQEPKPRPVQNSWVSPIDSEQFMPIGGGGGESIVTKLQKQAAVEQVKNSRVVKNGRKGKKVVIQRVNLF